MKMIILLALLTAFPAMSTDMFLPAIPSLVHLWSQPLAIINLALISFFVMYGISLLFYGPLADRFGRRPPLMAGMAVYAAGSICCGLAGSAETLIASRIIQGLGAAAGPTLALAVTKDLYTRDERENILATLGAILALAPMLAPIIGGLIMSRLTWPWIFFTQGAIGIMTLLLILRMPETLPEPNTEPLSRIAQPYARLMRNNSYLTIVAVMAVSTLPLFGFIASSAEIYVNGFHLTEQGFSYYFAFNASALLLGSLACPRLTRLAPTHRILTGGFVGILAGGALLLLLNGQTPWSMALPMALITFCMGMSRPLSNNLVLEQVERDAGAASSLLIFSYFVFGALTMWLISLDSVAKIPTLGAIGAASGGLCLTLWLLLKKRYQPAD